MGVPVDTMKARLKDKMVLAFPGPTLGMLWEKGSGDRHLALFAFAVYGLVVFPKALGYVPLIGIWRAISYSSLMFLSQYGYDQCVPTIAGLNRVLWFRTRDFGRNWKRYESSGVKP
ncbi:hypothetical protein Golax_003420 [Gossypium laxum]|uniref:Uncharacterized protein n=1 Tax=Gossypium laxum TaxID=34288 RepID=A0A7J9AFI7_9ROSI|nr:hypothetical protein [Gossypium laxum]